jgi:hypothetical protein
MIAVIACHVLHISLFIQLSPYTVMLDGSTYILPWCILRREAALALPALAAR